jgi:Virulence-associated protein E
MMRGTKHTGREKEVLHLKMELYDRLALRALLKHPGVRDECKALLAKYPKPGMDTSSTGQMEVKYRRAAMGDEKDDGRVYASRGSQGLDVEVRAELCHRFYHDLDMANAHPTLILWHARKEGWPCDRLAAYVDDRTATLARVKEYYNVERAEAKQLFCVLMFGGGLKKWEETNGCERHDMPELLALKREFKGLMDRVWDKYPKRDTFERGATLHDKKATNMSAWVCGHEYATLMVMHSVALEMGESPDVLIHDGLMIRKRPALDEARLGEVMRAMEARVKERLGYDIQLVEKKMEPLRTLDLDLTPGAPPDASGDVAYLAAKAVFEEKHFKVVMPCSFGTVRDDGTVEFCRREEFINRHEDVQYLVDGKPEPLLKRWLTDPQKRKYGGKDFRPFPADAELPEGWLNTFRGFDAERIPPNEEEVSIQPFLDLAGICCGDPKNKLFAESLDYLLCYLAHIVQRPGEKPNVALVLYSKEEGCGKGKLMLLMSRIIGTAYFFRTPKVSDLYGEFSVGRANRLLVELDEAEAAHTNKVMEFLKDFITSETCNYTEKYMMAATQLACERLVLTTNNSNCLEITTKTRRFAVLAASDAKCRDFAYWAEFLAWCDVPANRRAVYDFLKAYPGVERKDWVKDRPVTEAFLRMSVHALPPIMTFLAAVTQLTDGYEETKTGGTWFQDYQVFEEVHAIAPKDRLNEKAFGAAMTKLHETQKSGVAKLKRSAKGVNYKVTGSLFSAFAESLGLTECPDPLLGGAAEPPPSE